MPGPSQDKRPRLDSTSESGNTNYLLFPLGSDRVTALSRQYLGNSILGTARVRDRKYSTATASSMRFLQSKEAPAQQLELISAAFAAATWKKHEAAANSFIVFNHCTKSCCNWPLSENDIANYVTWAYNVKKLKSSTIESYLSSLKCIHALRSMTTSNFDTYYISSLLRGITNLEIYDTNSKSSRKVMSLQLLKILGHEISLTKWSKNSKQVLWSACTTAFFGSFRLGEILPSSEKNSNCADTLLWKDVNFVNKGHIIIHVKVSKNRTTGGDFVDVFSFPGHNVCPVKSLYALSNLSQCKGPDQPVFKFDTGLNLTLRKLNSSIRELLEPTLGPDSRLFTGHSFRAAIPAVLAKHPELSSSDEIMGWGRWKSSAYLSYTRLKEDQRRKIFGKITNILNMS